MDKAWDYLIYPTRPHSHGSQDELGNTGWGAVTFHRARATKANECLPNAEVYDAEAVGAFKAVKLAKEHVTNQPHKTLEIHTPAEPQD